MKKIVFRLMVLVMVILVIILAQFCLGSAPFDINFSKVSRIESITTENTSSARLLLMLRRSLRDVTNSALVIVFKTPFY